ncbi:helix-turn-helix domain-containing protein [Sutcliffiella cohnii]
MNTFLFIILYCIHRFHGERSASAIYHLLKGKKSSQTIQDAKLYTLYPLFGIFPTVARENVQDAVNYLLNHNFINQSAERYIVTVKGVNILNEWMEANPLPHYLNGWEYRDKWMVFWKRYTLITQTVSNLIRGNGKFIPIQYEFEVQLFVKQFLKLWNKEELAQQLKMETELILKKQPELEANLFVIQLSGYRTAGNTIQQAARKWSVDSVWASILFQACIHSILHTLKAEPSKFPVLSSLCNDLVSPMTQLTKTTQTTMHLIQKNYTIEEIAVIRNLKESTIEDHIVEITMNFPQFSIESYISEEQVTEIQEAIYQLQTKQLKKIKEAINKDDITYFQIRLVLSRMGDNVELIRTSKR